MANKARSEFVIPTAAGFSVVARVRLHDGSDAEQADISSISRTIVKLVAGVRVLVATDSVNKSTAIFDTLQSIDAVWDQSYNFKDDVAATKVLTGERHQVQYTFTPSSGAAIKTRLIDLMPEVSL